MRTKARSGVSGAHEQGGMCGGAKSIGNSPVAQQQLSTFRRSRPEVLYPWICMRVSAVFELPKLL